MYDVPKEVGGVVRIGAFEVKEAAVERRTLSAKRDGEGEYES